MTFQINGKEFSEARNPANACARSCANSGITV